MTYPYDPSTTTLGTAEARARAIAERIAETFRLVGVPQMPGGGEIPVRVWCRDDGGRPVVRLMGTVVMVNLGLVAIDHLGVMLWSGDDGRLGVCAGWPELREAPPSLRPDVREHIEQLDAITDGALRRGLAVSDPLRLGRDDNAHLLRLLDGPVDDMHLMRHIEFPRPVIRDMPRTPMRGGTPMRGRET